MVHVHCHLKVRHSFLSRFCNIAFRLPVASESHFLAGGADVAVSCGRSNNRLSALLHGKFQPPTLPP